MSFYISNAVAIERIIFVSLAILAFGLVSIGGLWLAQRRLATSTAHGDLPEIDVAVIAREVQPALEKAVRPLAPAQYEKLTPEEKLLRAIFGGSEKDEEDEHGSETVRDTAKTISR